MSIRLIHEPARDIPVVAEADVIVAGGGSAGWAAAVAAGREGADTVLVEQNAYCGGTATAGLMCEFGPLGDGKRQIVDGLLHALIHDLLAMDTAFLRDPDHLHDHYTSTIVDPEALKLLMQRRMLEASVRPFWRTSITDAIVEDGQVRGIIVENKSGRQAILGRVIVDATGDGDVAARAGAPFNLGRDDDGLLQPMTLVFMVGDVDQATFSRVSHEDILRLVAEARERGDFDIPAERPGSTGLVLRPGRRDDRSRCSFFINGTNIRGVDGTDASALGRAEMEAREQVQQYVAFLRKYIPGFAHCYLEQTAHQIGVRETRRITGEYTLTHEDIMGTRTFPDAICLAHNNIDIHEPTGIGFWHRYLEPGTHYEVPYRCLVPKTLNGLLVTGRCISATHDALGSTRVMCIVIPIGEATGVAAALCASEKIHPRDLEIPQLRQRLLERGVQLA